MTNLTAIPLAGGGTCRHRLLAQPLAWKLHWLLRLGVFLEFLGHGACGMNTKPEWIPYFHLFAIPDALAWRLMPLVGGLDVLLGLIALWTPRRALLLYMAAWGAFTALLRPAAGEGGWEFIERAYNYGVPFMFLLLHGFGHDRKSWFEPLHPNPILDPGQARTLLWLVRGIVGLMLIGHGSFGAFMAKNNLLGFYQSAGLGNLGLPLVTVRAGIGFFEIGLGVAAFFATKPGFFVSLFAWKVATESLYLVAGAKLACWEVVERGGSYVAPLATVCLLALLRPLSRTTLPDTSGQAVATASSRRLPRQAGH